MLVKLPAEGRKLPTTGGRQGPNTRLLIAFEDSYRVYWFGRPLVGGSEYQRRSPEEDPAVCDYEKGV
jgi:hypothetical protein